RLTSVVIEHGHGGDQGVRRTNPVGCRTVPSSHADNSPSPRIQRTTASSGVDGDRLGRGDFTSGQVAEMNQRSDTSRAQVAETDFQMLAVIHPQGTKQHAGGEVILRVYDRSEVVSCSAGDRDCRKKNSAQAAPNRSFREESQRASLRGREYN